MAKDVAGDRALNEFNMHYDDKRGWHYHVHARQNFRILSAAFGAWKTGAIPPGAVGLAAPAAARRAVLSAAARLLALLRLSAPK